MRSRSNSSSNCGPKLGLFSHFREVLAAACVLLAAAWLVRADGPRGSLEEAKVYYGKISKDLKYATPEKIGDTTLSDLAGYLGYKTLTAEKLEFDPPEKLKANGAAGDVLVSRFFAPKIMSVKFNEDDEKFSLGW